MDPPDGDLKGRIGQPSPAAGNLPTQPKTNAV
jgi:hypothetical protein